MNLFSICSDCKCVVTDKPDKWFEGKLYCHEHLREAKKNAIVAKIKSQSPQEKTA